MRFSETITATVGAMLVGATMANFPSPSPNGPSPNGPSPNGPGSGPELSSLERRSSPGPGPSPGHSFLAPGPKISASDPSPGPFSPGPDHTLEVRSDASSPFSPSPAGPGPKAVSPGPGPSSGSDHTVEARSDASSPSPAGPASENHPHPHPHPHSSGSDHPLFTRDEDPGFLVDPKKQSVTYNQLKDWKAPSHPRLGTPEEEAARMDNHWTLNKVAQVQNDRQKEFDLAVAKRDKDGLAKLDEWNKLSQQERDDRDRAAAKDLWDAEMASFQKKSDDKMAELDLWMEARKDADAKKQAELDQRAQKMKDENPAKMTNQGKKPGPVDDKPAAPPVDKEAEEKAKVEAERKLAEKLAADKAAAENLKKEAGAKLAAEKEEAKKAEQAAADKLTAEEEAAKGEKKKIDDKIDPEKLSADKEAAKIEKQKADEKLAEEKTAAEEAKKAAEAKLSEEKKEDKKEEKDAATKLKEEKEAIEKEEKAEKLRGHFEPSKHGVERIAKPKSCSCFEVFSHVLGFETKTSSPMDKFRFEFWGVKNRKCIEYCTHPFSKSEFESYRTSMEGKAVLPEKLPEHFYIEAGTSSGAHEKREEHATPHGAVTTQEAFDRLRADMDALKATQVNITGAVADAKDDLTNDNTYTPEPPKPLDPTKARLFSAAFPERFPKSNGKDGKKITDPKAAYNELHAAYNLWLVEFKNSLKNQRSGLNGDVKALKQLEQQAAKILEDAEKNFVKAGEEAAAAAAVDMRKEAFKELIQGAEKPKTKFQENVKAIVEKAAAAEAAQGGIVEGAAGKAPVHPENANTGIIPPA